MSIIKREKKRMIVKCDTESDCNDMDATAVTESSRRCDRVAGVIMLAITIAVVAILVMFTVQWCADGDVSCAATSMFVVTAVWLCYTAILVLLLCCYSPSI